LASQCFARNLADSIWDDDDDALDLQHLVKNEAWEHDQLVYGTTTTTATEQQ
jgi:hypothetical protein